MSRKSRRPNWPLRSILIGGFLLVVIYCLVIPIVNFGLAPKPHNASDISRTVNLFFDDVLHRAMDVTVAIWFLVLGSSIGSFLNVVVYRMPIGKSLVAKGSYCPHCRVPIRSTDNVPILGWIKLRGRCRACRLPISPRYPIVEAIVGAAFFIVFWAELATGGANLPGGDDDWQWGVMRIIGESRWDLFGLYLFQMTAFCILISASLIVYDGHRIPLKLSVFGCLVILICPVCWPPTQIQLHLWTGETSGVIGSLYPLDASPAFNQLAPWLQMLSTSVFGLLFGACFGAAIDRWVRGLSDAKPGDRFSAGPLVFGMAMCGGFLGWQSSLSVLGLSIILLTVAHATKRLARCSCRLNWLQFTTGTMVLHIVFWKLLDSMPYWPGSSLASTWIVVGQVATIGLLAIVLTIVIRRTTSATNLVKTDAV